MNIIHQIREKGKELRLEISCRKQTEIVWLSSGEQCQLKLSTLIYTLNYWVRLLPEAFQGSCLNKCAALRNSKSLRKLSTDRKSVV